jgi:hypothetical protein
LENTLPVVAEYGLCADVMEHIPEDKVEDVLRNVLFAAKNVFFGIHTGPDDHGRAIGEQLHVTQHPGEWWVERLKGLGFRVAWSQSGEQDGIPYFVVTDPRKTSGRSPKTDR